MSIYLAFGVGIGNLGKQTLKRKPMSEWVKTLNRLLRTKINVPVTVTAHFGHTGNFVVDSDALNSNEIAKALREVLGTPAAVLPVQDVRKYSAAISKMPPPNPEAKTRWTPGLAMQVIGSGCKVDAIQICRAKFRLLRAKGFCCLEAGPTRREG